MAAICGDECKLWGKVERHSCLQSSSSARPLASGMTQLSSSALTLYCSKRRLDMGGIPTTVGFLGLVERSKLVSYGTELPSEKDMDTLRGRVARWSMLRGVNTLCTYLATRYMHTVTEGWKRITRRLEFRPLIPCEPRALASHLRYCGDRARGWRYRIEKIREVYALCWRLGC